MNAVLFLEKAGNRVMMLAKDKDPFIKKIQPPFVITSMRRFPFNGAEHVMFIFPAEISKQTVRELLIQAGYKFDTAS